MRRWFILWLSILGMYVLIHSSCTLNPFGEDDISSGRRKITGSVTLNDGNIPSNVFVTTEGINVSAYTDSDGDFELILPAKSSQGTTSMSGVIKLFYYLANYRLKYSEIVVQDGEFVYARGDLNSDGKVIPVRMTRFLRIETEVNPSTVNASYTGEINVTVKMVASVDQVQVTVPYALPDQWGAVLLRKKGTETVYPFSMLPNQYSAHVVDVGRSQKQLSMNFNLMATQLPVGEYEVIPYCFVEYENIPEDITERLPSNTNSLSALYLKLPMKREGGDFTVR